jgi:glutamate--cysteine ligase
VLTKNNLVEYLSSGCTPRDSWLIGLEHEQFMFHLKTGAPLAYDGQPGVKQVLETLSARSGWKPKYEGEHIIALSKGNESITLEPAGQIELSGAPYCHLVDIIAEHSSYIDELGAVGDDLGIGFLSTGLHPQWGRSDIHWMPKARYSIMNTYLPTRGTLGLDMMTRTCGAQVNLDFENEEDMVRKFRVSMALQPLIIALFANSSVVEGQENGFASYRAHIWEDTDPDRCGVLPFIFEEGMGFERYADYMLDVPMFLIERDGQLIDMAGKSFRAFMAGKLPENETYTPELADWEMHLSTAFPEVRLKKYLELRGADSVSPPLLYALPAFWVGLLYDSQSLIAAEDMISNWTPQDHVDFRHQVARDGLDTRVPHSGLTIRQFAPSVIALARQGLERLEGQSEGLTYLDLLEEKSALAA